MTDPITPDELAMLKAHALNNLMVNPQSVDANDKLRLVREVERLTALVRTDEEKPHHGLKRWHVTATVHLGSGFERDFMAATESEARKLVLMWAHEQDWTDAEINEICFNSIERRD